LRQLQAGIVPVRRIEQHVQDIEALYQSVLKSSGSVA
jgi:hypothetical protein